MTENHAADATIEIDSVGAVTLYIGDGSEPVAETTTNSVAIRILMDRARERAHPITVATHYPSGHQTFHRFAPDGTVAALTAGPPPGDAVITAPAGRLRRHAPGPPALVRLAAVILAPLAVTSSTGLSVFDAEKGLSSGDTLLAQPLTGTPMSIGISDGASAAERAAPTGVSTDRGAGPSTVPDGVPLTGGSRAMPDGPTGQGSDSYAPGPTRKSSGRDWPGQERESPDTQGEPPEPEADPQPEPEPDPDPQPDPTPEPTSTPDPTPDPTPKPTPTPDPTPTPTPPPTPDPDPEPDGLRIELVTESSVTLAWPEAKLGLLGYVVLADGLRLAHTFDTTVTLTGLKAGATYSIAVAAVDLGGGLLTLATVDVTTKAG